MNSAQGSGKKSLFMSIISIDKMKKLPKLKK